MSNSSEKLEYFDFLRERLIADRASNEQGDVLRIEIDNKEFTCHRYILAVNSEYFAALFRNNRLSGRSEDTLSLPSEYVNESIFPKILESMYGEALEIKADEVILIFSASLYLQLPYFVRKCREYIIKNVKTLDVLELIRWPQIKFDQSLYTFLKTFINRHFSDYALRMVQLPIEIIEDLLTNVEVAIPHKNLLVEFGHSWVTYDLPGRKQYLPRIASILKPYHTASDRSLQLVIVSDKNLRRRDVRDALHALLEMPKIHYHSPKHESDHEALKFYSQDLLFFAQTNTCNNSGTQVATFRNKEWIIFDSIKLPVSSNLWTTYEGSIVGEGLYVSAEIQSTKDIVFGSFQAKTESWLDLTSPEKFPESLESCNSLLYSYESSDRNNQFSFFEPVLNRWFKTPAVKYPRKKAGITSQGPVLYMVGGELLMDDNTPKNVVEMYDSRCGFWSCIRVEQSLTINYIPYSKRVCCSNNMLYLFVPEGEYNLSCFDIRNNKWVCFIKNALASDLGGYALANNKEIWFVNENSTNEIRIYDSSTCRFRKVIYNLNVLNMKPISLPRKI